METAAAGFASLPALRLDSRLRGNDTRGCSNSSLPGVWGCPPILLLYPPRVGDHRGLKEGCETKVASGSYCGSLESLYAFASLAWPPPCEVRAKRQEMMQSGPRDMEHSHACYNSARRVNEHRGQEDLQDWGCLLWRLGHNPSKTGRRGARASAA